MKQIKYTVSAIILTTLALVGCQKAEAMEIGIGYADNKVIDEEGVRLTLGSEKNNVRYGIATTVTDERAESYGVYLGVPIKVQGMPLEFTPTITTEYYHEAKETVGGLGLGVGYYFTDSVRLDVVGTANRSFDGSDFDGEVYTIGMTKKF